MQLADHTCPFCLGGRSCLRFDRKGRPYFSCGACGARSFLVALRDAVRSIALVQPMLAARAEELAEDPDAMAAAHASEARVAAALRVVLSSPVQGATNTADKTREAVAR